MLQIFYSINFGTSSASTQFLEANQCIISVAGSHFVHVLLNPYEGNDSFQKNSSLGFIDFDEESVVSFKLCRD